MSERRLSPTAVLAGVVVLLTVLLVALLIALLRSSAGGSALPPAAIELSDGVPAGVEDSPPGALAAADSYLALSSESIEQDPEAFAALVAQVYLPRQRADTLAEAERLRANDPRSVANYRAGGRAIAVIGAHRLDTYTPALATVTTWLGGFAWGPNLAPRQSWNLVDTTLRWQSGRWLVASSKTDPVPAPVPATVYVTTGNDRASAFARLAGMTAPSYGAER
jgi:hypothetical protein